MINLRFISTCYRVFFLLPVSNSLIFLFFSSTLSFGEIVNGQGMSPLPNNISIQEACDNAKLEAQIDVLRKLGLERLKSSQVESCTDSGDKAKCQFYQSTFNFVSGGYIKNYEIIEKNPKYFVNNFKFCYIIIKAEAYKYKGEHDPEFVVRADIGDKVRFFEGSDIVIKGSLPDKAKAYINVLGWYPDFDKKNYYKLYPNKFENNNLLEGKFNIPSEENLKKYKIQTEFPKELKQDETQEFIIILATKRKFAILDKINISELLSRLDDENKYNWYMQKIGYSVLRKK